MEFGQMKASATEAGLLSHLLFLQYGDLIWYSRLNSVRWTVYCLSVYSRSCSSYSRAFQNASLYRNNYCSRNGKRKKEERRSGPCGFGIVLFQRGKVI